MLIEPSTAVLPAGTFSIDDVILRIAAVMVGYVTVMVFVSYWVPLVAWINLASTLLSSSSSSDSIATISRSVVRVSSQTSRRSSYFHVQLAGNTCFVSVFIILAGVSDGMPRAIKFAILSSAVCAILYQPGAPFFYIRGRRGLWSGQAVNLRTSPPL